METYSEVQEAASEKGFTFLGQQKMSRQPIFPRAVCTTFQIKYMQSQGHLRNQLLLFQFRNNKKANAQEISQDATSINQIVDIRWDADAHFFRRGVFILLYLGQRIDVLTALRTVFGDAIASKRREETP